ncbi:MAG: LamG domain-containing protein [Tannerella sp.]|jgi:hypothetical protein|nr:LamG domain-containing protein [Tannerella sp.]
MGYAYGPLPIGSNQIKPIFRLDFSSSTIADVSGNGYPVTNNGVTVTEKDGRKVGNFTAGCLTLDRTMFNNLWVAGTFTIDFYLNIANAAPSLVLFGVSRTGNTNAPGTIYCYTNTLYYVYNTAWSNMMSIKTITNNMWYRVRISVTNFNFKVFIDGQESASGTISGALQTWQLLLGGAMASNGVTISQNGFSGYISDFKIYNVAL